MKEFIKFLEEISLSQVFLLGLIYFGCLKIAEDVGNFLFKISKKLRCKNAKLNDDNA